MFSALAHQVTRGEDLIRDAQLVGDPEDHRLWQMRRATWISNTVAALEPSIPGETLDRFVSTVARYAGGGEYFESLPIELEGLRDGLAMLAGLGQQASSER